MDIKIWRRLDDLFAQYPMMRGSGVSDGEIQAAEHGLGRAFDPNYREFLRLYGAGMIGAQPVLGLSRVEVLGDDWWNVVHVTRHFWEDEWAGTRAWYIVSTDASGNPIGIDDAGRVWVSDHGTGTIDRLADDFAHWLRDVLSAAE